MTEFVKPIECPRCKGRGIVEITTRRVHAGAPGGCFQCDGAGVVEGDRDTIRAAKAAAEKWTRERTALGRAAFDHGHFAHSGLCHLETHAPERLAKAVANFAAGRTDVVPALDAYFRAEVMKKEVA